MLKSHFMVTVIVIITGIQRTCMTGGEGYSLIHILFQRPSLGHDITGMGFMLCPAQSSSITILVEWVILLPQGLSFGSQAVL